MRAPWLRNIPKESVDYFWKQAKFKNKNHIGFSIYADGNESSIVPVTI